MAHRVFGGVPLDPGDAAAVAIPARDGVRRPARPRGGEECAGAVGGPGARARGRARGPGRADRGRRASGRGRRRRRRAAAGDRRPRCCARVRGGSGCSAAIPSATRCRIRATSAGCAIRCSRSARCARSVRHAPCRLAAARCSRSARCGRTRRRAGTRARRRGAARSRRRRARSSASAAPKHSACALHALGHRPARSRRRSARARQRGACPASGSSSGLRHFLVHMKTWGRADRQHGGAAWPGRDRNGCNSADPQPGHRLIRGTGGEPYVRYQTKRKVPWGHADGGAMSAFRQPYLTGTAFIVISSWSVQTIL